MNGNQPNNRPRFPCPSCLKQLIIGQLHEYVGNHVVVKEVEATAACATIVMDLARNVRVGVSPHRVQRAVTRKFLKVPGISYDVVDNRIEITPEYVGQHLTQETPVETTFRENGFDNWMELHEVFRKRLFPNFRNDPQNLFVDPEIYWDSDEDIPQM